MAQQLVTADLRFEVRNQDRFRRGALMASRCLFVSWVRCQCPRCKPSPDREETWVYFNEICLGMLDAGLVANQFQEDVRFTQEVGGRVNKDMMSFCSECGTVVHLTQENHRLLIEMGMRQLLA